MATAFTSSIARRIQRLLGVACLGVLNAVAASASAAESNAIRTLYLVRHGTYVPDPKAPPETGPGLTPLGIAQARLVGARLSSLPVRFQSITSSTLTRAQQTAAEIRAVLASVPGSASALLSECTPPSMAAAADATQTACKQRLDSAFEKFAAPPIDGDRHDVLVCHGNVIRYFVTKALGADTRIWPSFGVANASLTIVRVRKDGSMQVMAVGDAGHIPPNLQSYGGEDDPQLVTPPLGVFATQ
jgi:serine/threonine-protein phosphatase PGAM5